MDHRNSKTTNSKCAKSIKCESPKCNYITKITENHLKYLNKTMAPGRPVCPKRINVIMEQLKSDVPQQSNPTGDIDPSQVHLN